DAAAGSAVADAILDASQSSPTYFPIYFTRVWKPQEERSVHFPSQVVKLDSNNQNIGTIQQRLPAHGVLFVAMSAITQLGGSDFTISISNPSSKPEREMWWLTGNVTDAWTIPAANTPVTITVPQAGQELLPQNLLHVIMRRRMGQEVVFDRKE